MLYLPFNCSQLLNYPEVWAQVVVTSVCHDLVSSVQLWLIGAGVWMLTSVGYQAASIAADYTLDQLCFSFIDAALLGERPATEQEFLKLNLYALLNPFQSMHQRIVVHSQLGRYTSLLPIILRDYQFIVVKIFIHQLALLREASLLQVFKALQEYLLNGIIEILNGFGLVELWLVYKDSFEECDLQPIAQVDHFCIQFL